MRASKDYMPLVRHEAAVHAALGVSVGVVISAAFAIARGLADERSVGAVLRELASNPVTYVFFATCTAAVVGVLGWLAGKRLDRVTVLATTDPLTVVANRHTFEARLGVTVAAALTARMPVALLVVDVDRLKEINDTHGHAGGDAALRSVAKAIVQSCRARDVVARWGGDEFVVLMSRTRADEALLAAERVRRALASACADGVPATSVSIGIAEYDGMAPIRPIALFDAADRALYEAKKAGRDSARVAASDALTAALPKLDDLAASAANEADYPSGVRATVLAPPNQQSTKGS